MGIPGNPSASGAKAEGPTSQHAPSTPADAGTAGELVGPGLALSGDSTLAATQLFKLLSDPTRLTILQQLAGGEVNVSTLCRRLDLPQPTVSHHLGLLRANSLIDNRRDGKQIFYRLNGRVSPAGIAGKETLAQTKGGGEVVRDVDGDGQPDEPTGLQIRGTGFTLQLLSADGNRANAPSAAVQA